MINGRDVAARRLGNSGLSAPRFAHPEEVVRWHGAMQAQDHGPAKWSVGQRSTGLTDRDLEGALAAGSIVRTHVLRPTWHFVARDDLRWLLALTGPRVQRHNGPRYRELGLDSRTLARCEELIGSALEAGNRLTRAAIGLTLEDLGVDTSGQRLAYVLMHCELEAVIASGGFEGRQHTYALVDDRVPPAEEFDRDQALAELTRRYLASHGPAAVQDLRWWSSLTVADIKHALSMLGAEVQNEAIDGLSFWMLASDAGRAPAARGAHLLQPYDELIVGYTESRYLGDPRAEAARAAWRDRRLPNGVLLAGDRVAGHWKRTVQRDSVTVEALTYRRPTPPQTRALETAARKLGRFLERPATLEVRAMG